MTITSYGYPKGIQDGSDLAQWSLLAGHRYSVAGFSDLRVTASLTGTRRANIAAGWAGGRGVAVHVDAPETLDLPAPSGSSQWFLVGLKRWSTNPDYDPEAELGTPEASPYTSELVYVAGTSSRAVPSVTQNPGVDDTQWLALCRVTSGDAQIVEVVDLRAIASESGAGYQVFSDLAMGQLEDLVGVEVFANHTRNGHVPTIYRLVSNGSGSLSWRDLEPKPVVLKGNQISQGPAEPGWSQQSTERLVFNGTMVWVHVDVLKSGGAIDADSRGAIGDHTNILTLKSDYQPPVPVSGSGYVTSTSGNTRRDCGGRINSNGLVHVTSTLPGAQVQRVTLDFFYAIGAQVN